MSKMGDFYIWLEKVYPDLFDKPMDVDEQESYLDEYLQYLKEEEE